VLTYERSSEEKILIIVEDNSDSREILRLFGTKIGHHPIKARNSHEAIMLAEAEEPDLIFMDMDLPDIDGVKTTAILKRNPKTSSEVCEIFIGPRRPIFTVKSWFCHSETRSGFVLSDFYS
jgi:CheY-like chemotaxis protein